MLTEGRVVATGSPADALTSELLRRVYDVEAIVAEHPATGKPTITFVPPSHASGRGYIHDDKVEKQDGIF